jgi:hypothetical protein
MAGPGGWSHRCWPARAHCVPGLTEQEPGDLAAALTWPEIYLILSGELSWSSDRITEILTTVVRSALLG